MPRFGSGQVLETSPDVSAPHYGALAEVGSLQQERILCLGETFETANTNFSSTFTEGYAWECPAAESCLSLEAFSQAGLSTEHDAMELSVVGD